MVEAEQMMVKGRKLTGLYERRGSGCRLDEMPFLLQIRLEILGATFELAATFQKNVVVDGRLVTGQNPTCSGATANALLSLLNKLSDRRPENRS